MAWQSIDWACGHTGSMQLYGKHAVRDARAAKEAGRKCMACWLLEQWKKEDDPRATREDRFDLACKIAEGKGKRISGEEIEDNSADNPLANISDEELIAEMKRRNLTIN